MYAIFSVASGVLAEAGMGSLTQNVWRLSIGALIFVIPQLIADGKRLFTWSALPSIFLGGGVMMLLSLTYIGAISVGTPVPVVAFLSETAPFFSLLLAWTLFREQVTKRQVMVACLGILGVVLVSGFSLAGKNSLIGDVLAIINAVLFAVYILLAKRFVGENKHSPQLANAWVFSGAGLWALLIIPFDPSVLAVPSMAFASGTAFVCLLAAPAATYFFLNEGLKHIGTFESNMILLTIPIFASVVSYFVLSEILVPIQVIGAGIIIGSIVTLYIKDASKPA